MVSFAWEGLSSAFALYGINEKDARWGSWHIRFLLAKGARQPSGSGSQWVTLSEDPSGWETWGKKVKRNKHDPHTKTAMLSKKYGIVLNMLLNNAISLSSLQINKITQVFCWSVDTMALVINNWMYSCHVEVRLITL